MPHIQAWVANSYSANRHGTTHNIPYLELEIRQDLISTSEDILDVAHRITRALHVFFPKTDD